MIEKEIGRYFDCCQSEREQKFNTKISRKQRKALVDAVVAEGLQGRSVLEIGCGPGDLVRELVRAGAERATGIDLAEKTIEGARRQTSEEGLSERIDFRVGNGATDPLQLHDVVVLDKVICCYPDWKGMIDNTASASNSLYGFIIPRSDGIAALFTKAFVGFGNVFLRVRRCGFKAFVHDYRAIDTRIREKGYERRHYSRGPIWMTAVYARP